MSKPAMSYMTLITLAIQNSPDLKCTLGGIYQYIMDHYPYYQNNTHKWQNCIRNNLSLGDRFVKILRDANQPGKGCYWTLHPNLHYLLEYDPSLRDIVFLLTNNIGIN